MCLEKISFIAKLAAQCVCVCECVCEAAQEDLFETYICQLGWLSPWWPELQVIPSTGGGAESVYITFIAILKMSLFAFSNQV